MNDSDLEKRLKSVRVPERSEDYWEDFPSRVRVQLRRERVTSTPQTIWRLRPAWAAGFALAVVLIFACVQFHPLQTVSLAIAKKENHFRAQLAQLDTGLHRLMLNTDGMGYLLAEAN